MRHTTTRTFAATLLAAALAFGTVACGDDSDGNANGNGGTPASTVPVSTDGSKLAALNGKRIGVQSATTGADYAKENAPDDAEIVEFDGADGLFGALAAGDIDAILQDFPVNAYRTTQDGTLQVVETYATDEQYGFAVAKGSELKGEIDAALKTLRDDGSYDLIFAKWFPTDGKAGPGFDTSDVTGTRTLTVCTEVPYPPMEMEGDGPRGIDYTGFTMEVIDAVAATMDAKIEVTPMAFDNLIPSTVNGDCDVAASSITINEERLESVDFSEPYFDSEQSLLVKK